MRQVNLREYAESEYMLSDAECDVLLGEAKALDLAIMPIAGEGSAYRLKPGSTVGAVEVGGLSVLIQPKIGIPQLLSLACYAMGAYRLQEERLFDFEERVALPDALAFALGAGPRGGRSHAGCSTGISPRRRRFTPCGGASGSTSRFGVGSASPCRSRCATTSLPTTSWQTVW